MTFNPEDCRGRSRYCAQRAAEIKNDELKKVYSDLSLSWKALAIEFEKSKLEERRALGAVMEFAAGVG